MCSNVAFSARDSGWLNGFPPLDGSVVSKFDAGKFRLTSTPLAFSLVPAARASGLASSTIVRVTASASPASVKAAGSLAVATAPSGSSP